MERWGGAAQAENNVQRWTREASAWGWWQMCESAPGTAAGAGDISLELTVTGVTHLSSRFPICDVGVTTHLAEGPEFPGKNSVPIRQK